MTRVDANGGSSTTTTTATTSSSSSSPSPSSRSTPSTSPTWFTSFTLLGLFPFTRGLARVPFSTLHLFHLSPRVLFACPIDTFLYFACLCLLDPLCLLHLYERILVRFHILPSLSRTVRGVLVYLPDVAALSFRFVLSCAASVQRAPRPRASPVCRRQLGTLKQGPY